MRIYVVCIWIFLSEIRSSSTDGIETHGYIGKHVTISCRQSWAWSNRKYFCRDPCEDEDVLVSSDQSSNVRFSLKDFENGTFTVTITNLQETDSGIYWCGVDRFGPDTYEKINLTVTKDITPTSTELDTTRLIPTLTQQPESLFVTSSMSSRSSTPDDITQSPSTSVSSVSVNISLYAVGGLIAVIILVCGPVSIYLYKKMVKTSAGLVPVTPVDLNEGKVEEATNVYENDLQDTPKSKQMKSKQLKSKAQKSESHSVYGNVELNTSQSDHVIYGNL